MFLFFWTMRCEVCDSKVESIFLGKMLGTVVKNGDGKKHYVCSGCQRRLGNDKKKILAGMKKGRKD